MKTLIACALTALLCAGVGLAGFKPVRPQVPKPVKTVIVCAFTPSGNYFDHPPYYTGMICVPRSTK